MNKEQNIILFHNGTLSKHTGTTKIASNCKQVADWPYILLCTFNQ